MMEELEKKIEALLFYENRPLSYREIAKILQEKEEDIREAVKKLSLFFQERGIQLIQTDEQIAFSVRESFFPFLQEREKEEQSRDLSKQALETLSIILYKGEVSKHEIDYIRGVNSTFILRNLRTRGLIERKQKSRESIYFASPELYAFLGISEKGELPQYEDVMQKLQQIEVEFSEEVSN